MRISHKEDFGFVKRVSIRDVAKAAGVSITTVSKALNGYPDVNPDTKKRIEQIVQEMNYVPDMAGRSMGGISTPAIGLLINDLLPEEPSGAVYGFLSGVCTACRDNAVDFLLLATDAKAQRQVQLKQLCLSKNLSGLICCGFLVDDPYIQQMSGLGIPCVSIDTCTQDPDIIDVTIDNTAAADEAVTHLIQTGRKHIAMLCGNTEADVSNRRYQGYCNAMERAGLPLREDRVLYADFNQKQAYLQTKALLNRDPEVDAIFCASDLMALGTCQALEEAGIAIGAGVSVVGFDDIPIAQFVYGGLTTIHQNFYAMGYKAGEVIYEKISGKRSVGSPGELLYKLMVRSTAPAQ